MRRLTLSLFLLAVLFDTPARAFTTRQLTFTPASSRVTVNGTARALTMAPFMLGSRLLVPLLDTVNLLELAAPDLTGVPLDETAATQVDGTTFVDARWLAGALGAALDVTPLGMTFTVTRAPQIDPAAPQARFTTDKLTYAPGEKVNVVDYSFDPDGVAITKRNWEGLRDAYFTPGVYPIRLQVTNAQGKVSSAFTRTITVQGEAVSTPLDFALRHTAVGDMFSDPDILTYRMLSASGRDEPDFPLLFSDSPEKPTRPGVLYRDVIGGRARVVAHHVNGLAAPARVYVIARNLETHEVALRTTRTGETAPTRIVGTLGQVTLMDYFSGEQHSLLMLPPGRAMPLYASPLLTPGSGVNLMQDLLASGRVEVSFVILPEGTFPTPDVLAALEVLPPDGLHVRGTFPSAVRHLRVDLDGKLPARLNLGDGRADTSLQGVDALTGAPVKLNGNYGLLYRIEVLNAAGTVVALSPRGGGYRGAMQLTDGAMSATLRVPRSGVLSSAVAPVLLWRAQDAALRFDFVPASGSSLPVALIFYRSPR